MSEINPIAIIGCGWLGSALAARLSLENQPFIATCSSSSSVEKLSKQGIKAIRLHLTPEIDSPHFSQLAQAKMAVVLLPPRVRQGHRDYPEKIQHLTIGLTAIGVDKIIFASSTSVYPSTNRAIDESEVIPNPTGNQALIRAAELRILDYPELKNIIVRFAGLCGPGREPGRLLAGRKNLAGAINPVNLIHQNDAISILIGLIKYQPWHEIFNACAPKHPTKSELYPSAARKLGLEIPNFSNTKSPFKKIIANKICKHINFDYSYPNPKQW